MCERPKRAASVTDVKYVVVLNLFRIWLITRRSFVQTFHGQPGRHDVYVKYPPGRPTSSPCLLRAGEPPNRIGTMSLVLQWRMTAPLAGITSMCCSRPRWPIDASLLPGRPTPSMIARRAADADNGATALKSGVIHDRLANATKTSGQQMLETAADKDPSALAARRRCSRRQDPDEANLRCLRLIPNTNLPCSSVQYCHGTRISLEFAAAVAGGRTVSATYTCIDRGRLLSAVTSLLARADRSGSRSNCAFLDGDLNANAGIVITMQR